MNDKGTERRENPMKNDLVIEMICKYLDYESLRAVRTLNKQWKNEADKSFWKACPPIILHKSNFERTFEHSVKDLSISRFLRVYSNHNHIDSNAHMIRQCKTFRVTGLSTNKQVQLLMHFLALVGPTISSLDLFKTAICRNSQDLYDILCCKYTPDLECLMLDDVTETIDNHHRLPALRAENRKYEKNVFRQNKKFQRLTIVFDMVNDCLFGDYPVDWLDLLLKYPYMTTLELDGLLIRDFQDISFAILSLRPKVLTKLKWHSNERKFDNEEEEVALFCFDVSHDPWIILWRQALGKLESSNLPLRFLDVDNYYPQNTATIISFWNSLSTTLERLVYSIDAPHDFPLLVALQQLKITVTDPDDLDFRFLSKVPSLKSLNIASDYVLESDSVCYDGVENSIYPTGDIIPIHYLKKLKCGFLKRWLAPELKILFSWIPNLTKLTMCLNNKTLPWVCENLPQLRELKILGDKINDSGVLGEESATSTSRLYHGISNLKELETFIINPAWHGSFLTEKSVFQGFSKMPRLNTLEFSASTRLNQAAENTLAMFIQNVTVHCNGEEFLY